MWFLCLGVVILHTRMPRFVADHWMHIMSFSPNEFRYPVSREFLKIARRAHILAVEPCDHCLQSSLKSQNGICIMCCCLVCTRCTTTVVVDDGLPGRYCSLCWPYRHYDVRLRHIHRFLVATRFPVRSQNSSFSTSHSLMFVGIVPTFFIASRERLRAKPQSAAWTRGASSATCPAPPYASRAGKRPTGPA